MADKQTVRDVDRYPRDDRQSNGDLDEQAPTPHRREQNVGLSSELIGAGLRLVVGGFDPFATTWGSAAYSEAPQARSP